MLLPKRMIRKYNYVYDENDIKIKVYSFKQTDEAVSIIYMRNRQDFSTKVITNCLNGRINHILYRNGIKTYLSEEQYLNSLKIALFKIRYYVINIKSIVDENDVLCYQLEMCPLMRKIKVQTRTLVKN